MRRVTSARTKWNAARTRSGATLGQIRPGQPVGGELHGQRGEARLVGQRAGLPVDDRVAAIRVGEHRIHPAPHPDARDHRLERHLGLDGTAVRPRRWPGTPPAAPPARRRSAAPSSAAPGSSSRSSSWAAPNRCSSQAWNAVPRRACGLGGSGSGRRSREASPAGSAASSTSRLTVSCGGSSTAGRARAAARSASSTSTSAAQPSGSSSSGSGGGSRSSSGSWDAGIGLAAGRRARRAGAQGGPDQLGARLDVGRAGAERVGGPERGGLLQRGRVDGVGRRAPRPRSRAPCASADLDEELRRQPRLLAGGGPAVPGQQQHPLGPGERHVEQPPLLDQASLVERLGVGLDGVLAAPGGRRRRGG